MFDAPEAGHGLTPRAQCEPAFTLVYTLHIRDHWRKPCRPLIGDNIALYEHSPLLGYESRQADANDAWSIGVQTS